jgi:hypothetical protein
VREREAAEALGPGGNGGGPCRRLEEGRRSAPSGGATAGAWRRGGPCGSGTGRQRRHVDREAVTLGWAKATRPRLYWEAAEGVGGGREWEAAGWALGLALNWALGHCLYTHGFRVWI